jgi:hypothetical protein
MRSASELLKFTFDPLGVSAWRSLIGVKTKTKKLIRGGWRKEV